MNVPKQQGSFRFGLPQLPGEGLGFTPTAHGGMTMLDDIAAARQHLCILLATDPGERVMEPGFGCNLRHLVFEPGDDTTAGLAMHYVRQAVEQWMPEIELIDIQVGPDARRQEVFVIDLQYRLRNTGSEDRLQDLNTLTGAKHESAKPTP